MTQASVSAAASHVETLKPSHLRAAVADSHTASRSAAVHKIANIAAALPQEPAAAHSNSAIPKGRS